MATTPPIAATEQQPISKARHSKVSAERVGRKSTGSSRASQTPITTRELASLQKRFNGASLNFWRLRRYGTDGQYIGFVRIDCPYCGWYPQDTHGWFTTSRRKTAVMQHMVDCPRLHGYAAKRAETYRRIAAEDARIEEAKKN